MVFELTWFKGCHVFNPSLSSDHICWQLRDVELAAKRLGIFPPPLLFNYRLDYAESLGEKPYNWEAAITSAMVNVWTVEL